MLVAGVIRSPFVRCQRLVLWVVRYSVPSCVVLFASWAILRLISNEVSRVAMGAGQSSTPEDEIPVAPRDEYVLRHPLFRYAKFARTGLGLLTVIVIFTLALNSILSIVNVHAAVYLLCVGTPMFLLEYGTVIRTLCGNNGFLCRSFSLILDFDKKKRAILYILFAIPSFLDIFRSQCIVAGIFMLATAFLYMLKGCEKKKLTESDSSSSRGVQPARVDFGTNP